MELESRKFEVRKWEKEEDESSGAAEAKTVRELHLQGKWRVCIYNIG